MKDITGDDLQRESDNQHGLTPEQRHQLRAVSYGLNGSEAEFISIAVAWWLREPEIAKYAKDPINLDATRRWTRVPRPPGGRLPDPGPTAVCVCGQPRASHGGSRHLGACPGERGGGARRFRLRDEDKPADQLESEA